MSDLFYENDAVIPFVLTFRAERVRHLLNSEELHRMFRSEPVRPL